MTPTSLSLTLAGLCSLLVAGVLALAALPKAQVPPTCGWFLGAGCGLLVGAAVNERWRR